MKLIKYNNKSQQKTVATYNKQHKKQQKNI